MKNLFSVLVSFPGEEEIDVDGCSNDKTEKKERVYSETVEMKEGWLRGEEC